MRRTRDEKEKQTMWAKRVRMGTRNRKREDEGTDKHYYKRGRKRETVTKVYS